MANELVEMIARQARHYGEREAYRFCWRKEGEWLTTSWNEFSVQIDVVAKALAVTGILPEERIAICSPNTPQILISEFAAFKNRVSSIPVYAASSQDQFDFIVSNGHARIVFIGDSHQYPLAYEYQKKHDDLLAIVIFKNDGFKLHADDKKSIFWDDFILRGINAPDNIAADLKRRTDAGRPEDIATLIYTSGTTGEPKGVVITHANYNAAMRYHLARLDRVSDSELSMSFLPMSHILEKAWCLFCLTKGVRIAINYDPRTIQDTIHNVHPNLMCCVPRFWEKVYAAVKEKIASMGPVQRIMVKRALKIGRRRNLDYCRRGLKVPALLEKEYRFWDKKLFSVLKRNIGIPEPNMFPTAGAPISDRIVEFFRSVEIDIIVGYGLSETTATVTCYPDLDYRIGTVGTPLEEISVRISEEGEILVKGATVTPGYYDNPEANKAAFTADGYFRTGDAGYIDEYGALVLTERIKDLFKTSNGKYVAPQALESRLAENKYIDEVAVIGESRKYVTALVVPNYHHLRRWADEHGIKAEDTAQLVADPRVRDFVFSQIEPLQADQPAYARIKKIRLLPHPFSIMNGEVTNTMKVRRPVVAKRYEREIDEMYKE